MVVSNFHGTESLRNVRVSIPDHAWNFMGRSKEQAWKFTDRLESGWSGISEDGALRIEELGPCSALVLEISR
jgi:hypothetical protein